MSAIDWVCKKISLESASGQLLAITISCQQVLPSKLDACVNVTTCCWHFYTSRCLEMNIMFGLLVFNLFRNFKTT